MANFIEFLYSRFLLSDGVSIDTRTLQRGNLFFAVSGPNFNANQFAKEALDKGASYAVVDDHSIADDDRIIYAKNGLVALRELAIFHRSRIKRPVIGITGSNGKTTTKELIARVLERKYAVFATPGNYNNHIGVPLSILHIHPQVEIAIIEMGANHVGEIAQLCKIARPTHGLITNIGRAHTETFGGIEGVIRGKSELFDFLRRNEGVAFINNSDTVLSNMAKRFTEPLLYPEQQLSLLSSTPFLKIAYHDHERTTQLVGRYNYVNIAAALAVGSSFEVDTEQSLDAIASYVPDNARSQVIKKGETTIILDAYNANPDSMKAAIENLGEHTGLRMAILGDMNELENPDVQHLEVLDYAKSLGIKEILTVGENMGRVSNIGKHFDSKEALEAYVKERDLTGYSVLLKASNSIRLESILKSIA